MADAALTDELGELQRRVEDLRAFEREYRSRLCAYLTSQLRDLRQPGPVLVQVGRCWTNADAGVRLRIVSHGDVSEPGAV